MDQKVLKKKIIYNFAVLWIFYNLMPCQTYGAYLHI